MLSVRRRSVVLFSNRAAGCLCIIFALMLGASGCDSIDSIKRYFQEPEKETAAVSAPAKTQKVSTSVVMGPDTLARVGNWTITVEEFNERLAALKEVVPEYDISDPEARRLVLDELINQQVLVLGAEKTGLARQKDIYAAVDEFRRTLIVREVARQLTENIVVSENEARIFYDENRESLIDVVQWRVREIVVPAKEQATNILGQILAGADFAQMARQHSKGKTAANGGDLGFITEEPFAQMGNALLSLEVGDVSGVFKGPDGYYVAKLEEKKGGEQIGFEEIKEDIIQSQMLLEQQQVILDHLNRLKESTKIKINENLLVH